MDDDLREGDEDFHKPKPKYKIITWEEAVKEAARLVAADMIVNPTNWVVEFSTDVLIREMHTRGYAFVKVTGDTKNEPRSN